MASLGELNYTAFVTSLDRVAETPWEELPEHRQQAWQNAAKFVSRKSGKEWLWHKIQEQQKVHKDFRVRVYHDIGKIKKTLHLLTLILAKAHDVDMPNIYREASETNDGERSEDGAKRHAG